MRGVRVRGQALEKQVELIQRFGHERITPPAKSFVFEVWVLFKHEERLWHGHLGLHGSRVGDPLGVVWQNPKTRHERRVRVVDF